MYNTYGIPVMPSMIQNCTSLWHQELAVYRVAVCEKGCPQKDEKHAQHDSRELWMVINERACMNSEGQNSY